MKVQLFIVYLELGLESKVISLDHLETVSVWRYYKKGHTGAR